VPDFPPSLAPTLLFRDIYEDEPSVWAYWKHPKPVSWDQQEGILREIAVRLRGDPECARPDFCQHPTLIYEYGFEHAEVLVSPALQVHLEDPEITDALHLLFQSAVRSLAGQPSGRKLVSLIRGRLSVVAYVGDDGKCCFCLEDEAPKDLTFPPEGTPDDRVSDSDREWFKAHPGRDLRIRKRMRGESLATPPGFTGCRWVAVVQIRVGFRTRIAIPAKEKPPEGIIQEYVERYIELTMGMPLSEIRKMGEPATSPGDPSP